MNDKRDKQRFEELLERMDAAEGFCREPRDPQSYRYMPDIDAREQTVRRYLPPEGAEDTPLHLLAPVSRVSDELGRIKDSVRRYRFSMAAQVEQMVQNREHPITLDSSVRELVEWLKTAEVK